jgi:hypothetical protein
MKNDFLVSAGRAGKLSGAWGRPLLLGRTYLPANRAGTERVADLRRKYPPERFLPVLYGCSGVIDVTTIEAVLQSEAKTDDSHSYDKGTDRRPS